MSTAPQRISVEEATRLVDQTMPRWPVQRVPLAEAGGAVLREVICAERDQPPFDRVTMDGIAVAGREWQAGRRRFRIAGTQGAGAAAGTLASPEDCIEVMTGGVLPRGADTIIPVERLACSHGEAIVESGYAATPGQFVHRRGSDHARGKVLLEPGCRIGPAEMAVLTIGGQADVAITRWPRISVISTGDELVEAGAPIEDFQIRSSNDRAIETALRQRGFMHTRRSTLRDDPAAMTEIIGRLHGESDLLILSGGVSMGQFDHVPRILTSLGVQVVFHKIAQRPGLPMWFGRDDAGRCVFALPGNPVSSLVCLVRYVVPGLAAAMGATPRPPPKLRLGATVNFRPDLSYFLPVILATSDDGEITAVPHPTNTSGDFVSLAGTDGFVELPRGRDDYPAGYAASFYHWSM